MKTLIALTLLLSMVKLNYAQTNIFPVNGNVGIGTLTPVKKLSINGDVGINGNLAIQMSTDGSGFKLQSSYSENKPIVEATQEANDGFLYVRSALGTSISKISGYPASPTYFLSNVGIGVTNPSEKLSVNGKIRAQEIKVETANWPDYVFTKGYELPSLRETEQHIKEKGHLFGIPSAEEVKNKGIELGDMNAKLLKKIEELTLYMIELNKTVEKQQLEINKLKQKN